MTATATAATTAVSAPLSAPGRRIAAALLDAVLTVVTLGIGWIIWSVLLWSKGQTPAKSIMKMRTVDAETGRCAEMGQMVMREVVGNWILGFLRIISLFTVFGDKRQAVADMLAKTLVVDDPDGRLAP